MCGFTGIFDFQSRRDIDPARLERMTTSLVHRGPDGEGALVKPGVALGHRRLAIIDVAGGQQPLSTASGRITTVFNGEIYNFQELTKALSGKGYSFRTKSDTEALVNGWEAWGADCLQRLRGMFALAIWDQEEESLTLARDRVGERPVYYTVTEDGLAVFGSELRAVVAGLPEVPPLNNKAVADYFAYGYVPDPKSIFQGVYKLPPGHFITFRRGEAAPAAPTPYWTVQFHPDHALAGADMREELIDRFGDAVRAQMLSDVPLGAFLSGGVDSSGVVAMMSQASEMPVRTCSIGFNDLRFDESDHAQKVADLYKTNHHAKKVDVDACSLIDKLAIAYTEPFADSSALPTYLVSKLARETVTVALSGDGGDELFAGYRRYPFYLREERTKAMLPGGLNRVIFGPLAKIYPRMDWAPRVVRAKATFEALAADRARGYFRSVCFLPETLRAKLFSDDFVRSLSGYDPADVLREHFDAAGTDDPLAAAQYADFKTWLPGRMLVKVDRAAMANSLEVRPPILDHKLVEWAGHLPASTKLDGFSGKMIFKRALEPHVPSDLLYRRKQGFSMPLASWMRNGLEARLSELTSSGPLAQSGMFNMPFITTLVREHQSANKDHSMLLWTLIMYDAFLRRPWADPEASPA